ncbi:hypothetical protein TNCV_3529291 [Trichonephila clavipes]|uniref:Uncharacterized protein n=1 Tax=Trichonephila clavipes TaxID=2585209 RepID=A0A8X6RBR5_TRICX|nr:hypothetical protein TNCV_3529291 [Trichonephila clavipes]
MKMEEQAVVVEKESWSVAGDGIIELTEEHEGDEKEVNTSQIIVKGVPGSLEVRSGDSFQLEPLTSSSVSTKKEKTKS